MDDDRHYKDALEALGHVLKAYGMKPLTYAAWRRDKIAIPPEERIALEAIMRAMEKAATA